MDRVAENLLRLVDDLVLFLGVAVRVERPVERDDVAQRVARYVRSVPAPGCPKPRPSIVASKSTSPFAPLPDGGLVGGDNDPLHLRDVVQRLAAATQSGIATQFGFATMPFLMWCSSSALTSGTTSGQSGSMRQAEELSTTIAPAFAAIGENSLLTPDGVL